ncbi:uncharacterized protein [Miscanthus floridulus]|uniref:uncharacterized protein n=1 Tax=Miscanthus floridulus TaxID=154761 RepID=UPI00345B1FB9
MRTLRLRTSWWPAALACGRFVGLGGAKESASAGEAGAGQGREGNCGWTGRSPGCRRLQPRLDARSFGRPPVSGSRGSADWCGEARAAGDDGEATECARLDAPLDSPVLRSAPSAVRRHAASVSEKLAARGLGAFVWRKKLDRELSRGILPGIVSVRSERLRCLARRREADGVRVASAAARPASSPPPPSPVPPTASLTRAEEEEAKEAAFLLQQGRLRAAIRFAEGRPRRVDMLVESLRGARRCALTAFRGASVEELKELAEEIAMLAELDRENGRFWEAAKLLCDAGMVKRLEEAHEKLDSDTDRSQTPLSRARAGAAVAASQAGARASVSRGSAGGARQLERRDRMQQEAAGQGSTARESCGSGAGHRVPVNRGSVAARAGFSKPQASNGAGVLEGVTLLEFEQELLEEQQQAQEQEVQAPKEGANKEVLECPDHRLSSFLKGKP